MYDLLQAQIDSIKNELSFQVHECGVSENNDNVQIVVGAGGSVKFILMPDQYRTVTVKASESDYSLVWSEQVIEKLSKYGPIERHDYKILKKEQKLFVTFFCPEDAMKSTQLRLPNVTIEPRMFRAQGGQQFSLQFEWSRRKRVSFGFIEFNNEENLTIALQHFCFQLRPRLHLRRGVDAIKYQKSKDGKCQLFATNVDTSLTDDDIKEHIPSELPMVDEGDFEIKLGFQKSFETPKPKVDRLKQQLHDLIMRYADKNQYSLSMSHPQN